MSRQSSMHSFFKAKSGPPSHSPKINENVGKKRRSLSLNKPVTPIKSKKQSDPNITPVDTFDLCSDEENRSEMSQPNAHTTPDFSQSTVYYALTPKTPQKTTQSTPQSASSSSFRSTGSEKFYSPTKKRAVKKRTPVKRSLCLDFFRPSPATTCISKDELFEQACDGMDDKTIFLLTIIKKCIQDESLNSLLDKEAQEVLAGCMHVVQPGMRLVSRLFWHQHIWYRRDKIKAIASGKLKPNSHENTIDDTTCHLMINSLLQSGLIVDTLSQEDNSLGFDDYISLLKSDELKSLCKELKIKTTSKKHAKEALVKLSKMKTISAFLQGGANSDNSKRILHMLKQKTGVCYKLSELARSSLQKLYLLMYLGIDYSVIREKKLELILLYDKINRETYPIDKEMEVDNASLVFRNSQEFLRFVAAHNIYEEFLAETEWQKKCVIVLNALQLYKGIDGEDMMRYEALPPWLRRFTPPNIYVKILEAGIQELKKHKTIEYYTLAVDILTALISQNAFRQHKKAEWCNEKALILHKLLNRVEEAAEVLMECFKSGLSDEALDVLRPRAGRLAQGNTSLRPALRASLAKLAQKDSALECTLPGEHLPRTPMENENRGKIKFQTRTENLLVIQTAEECCISHYLATRKFTHGEHWEGGIVSSVYFLLFWDIIYSKPPGVAGVFLTHYQKYPLDMYSDSFYINRKTSIDDRLAVIENSTADVLVDMVTEKWDERPEHEVSGVVRGISLEELCGVLRALGPSGAAAVCRRLATHYGYTHSGFPDLTLWNVHTNKVKFVEVKTDADKPSMKQIQWMHYLKENGIDTGFCYVGVNTSRCKARARERDSSSD